MMPFVKLPGGIVAHVKMSRRPVRKCRCGARSTRLCDFPKAPSGTCDKPLCAGCTINHGRMPSGESIDYCPDHPKPAEGL